MSVDEGRFVKQYYSRTVNGVMRILICLITERISSSHAAGAAHVLCAEGGSAAQAIATAAAHALAAGGSEGVAIARAFAVALVI